MPTIIATAGANNANSYCTVAEADAYFETQLYATTWTDADQEDKEKAMIMATRILDEEIDWQGVKTSEDQALRWPRGNVEDRDGYIFVNDEIPVFLQNATAELAHQLLLKNRFQTLDDAATGIKSVKAGSVAVEFDKMDRISLLPQSVLSMIEPYHNGAQGGMEVPLVRA